MSLLKGQKPHKAGDRIPDMTGTVWVLVTRQQQRQTVNMWIANAPDTKSYVSQRRLILDGYVHRTKDIAPGNWEQHIGVGNFGLCMESELDEEVNEFGPISP